MLNNSEIRSSFFGLVGLRQSYNPNYDILDSTITASTSGMYFDQYSSYLLPENIIDTQPYADITDENFNTWLTNKIKDSALTALQKCFSGNDFIENALLYDKSNRKVEAYELANEGDFVGFEVEVAKRKDLRVIINKIIGEFSGTGTVKLLVFNDNLVDPIYEKEISISSKSATSEDVGWSLPYSNDVQGGRYYVGYLTSGLTVKAINREYEQSNLRHLYKKLSIKPIRVAGWNSETLFDIDNIEDVDESFGLNFDISSYYDYTSIATNNKEKFADVIGYQFAADMLGMMVTSNRTNATERMQRGNILLELQGNTTNDELPTVIGVNEKLKDAVKKVKKELIEPGMVRKFTVK